MLVVWFTCAFRWAALLLFLTAGLMNHHLPQAHRKLHLQSVLRVVVCLIASFLLQFELVRFCNQFFAFT